MTFLRRFAADAVVGGLFILLPIYLAVLLLLKGVQSLVGLLKPISASLPDWGPGEDVLALVLVIAVSFIVGAAVRTRVGRTVRERVEKTLLGKLPGYELFRSLTQRLAGEGEASTWKPALVEIEDGLVPAFIVEIHDDGRYTIFVPSIPTPFAGAVYILAANRVHPVDVPLAQAIKSISRWGTGSRDMVAAMEAADASGGRERAHTGAMKGETT